MLLKRLVQAKFFSPYDLFPPPPFFLVLSGSCSRPIKELYFTRHFITILFTYESLMLMAPTLRMGSCFTWVPPIMPPAYVLE